MVVRFRAALAALVVLAVAVPSGGVAATCWWPPVVAPVSDPFRPPACPWCPGNRGIEYDTRPGQGVTAVEGGRVSYAGTIAGTMYVVIEHRDGRRATYGRLSERRHQRGDVVLRGQVVGATGDTFHFGVRVGDDYVDPGLSIGRLVGRPRLVPSDGSAAAPAPPPVLRCEQVRPAGRSADAPRRETPIAAVSMIHRSTVR
ncbi:MAG TPA: M23 family metallopeptidase [Ilumatobacter sp.]|nr:M23 family metallopeptidase [Ilumatobacter sp.]